MTKLFPKTLLVIFVALFFSNCTTKRKFNDKQNISAKPVPEENKYDSTRLEPIYKRLKSGDTLSSVEVEQLADDVETRAYFYTLLTEFHKESMFPSQYLSFEKASESYLANWLAYPTELDAIPSKIELDKKVDIAEHDTTFTYYVFKFKTDGSHWAAKNGWMLGAVGPYLKDSHPYDWTNGTFSRLTKISETTAQEEANWIHQNIFRSSPQ